MVLTSSFVLPLSIATCVALATADYSETAAQPRYGSLPSIEPATIYTGIWDPNNIAIHVAQNFINFAVSTVFWFFASFFYSENQVGRQLRESLNFHNQYKKRSVEETAEEAPEDQGMLSVLSGKRLAAMLRSFADASEGFDRYTSRTGAFANLSTASVYCTPKCGLMGRYGRDA